jgi:hypothetical protein
MTTKYTVRNKEFSSFSTLVQWVWDTYKIDFEGGDEIAEHDKQTACKDLDGILDAIDGEIASCSQCGWWSNQPGAFHACEYIEEDCE